MKKLLEFVAKLFGIRMLPLDKNESAVVFSTTTTMFVPAKMTDDPEIRNAVVEAYTCHMMLSNNNPILNNLFQQALNEVSDNPLRYTIEREMRKNG